MTDPTQQDLPEDLEAAILDLKEERGAILLAHYYQEPAIQDLADYSWRSCPR